VKIQLTFVSPTERRNILPISYQMSEPQTNLLQVFQTAKLSQAIISHGNQERTSMKHKHATIRAENQNPTSLQTKAYEALVLARTKTSGKSRKGMNQP
jgi:hypothetical protein